MLHRPSSIVEAEGAGSLACLAMCRMFRRARGMGGLDTLRSVTHFGWVVWSLCGRLPEIHHVVSHAYHETSILKDVQEGMHADGVAKRCGSLSCRCSFELEGWVDSMH